MNEVTRRDFVRGGLTAGIGIGLAPELLRSAVAPQKQAAASAPAAGTDPYALVDPELLAAVKQFPFPRSPSPAKFSLPLAVCPLSRRCLLRRRSHLNGTSRSSRRAGLAAGDC